MIRPLRLARHFVLLLMLIGASTVSAAPAVYSIDAAKSALEFEFVQAGAKNKGRFPKLAVNFNFDAANLAAAHLDVVIDLPALDSGDKERDDTLRDADLFDVAKFPQAHFAATQIVKTAAGGYEAVGSFTLRGVVRPLRVPFTLRSATEQGASVLYMSGKTLIKRLDFGVGQGDWKSTEWVGPDVNITFTLRLVAAS
ncbi:MAG TPA: YceI family protein [Steroidobacteraceae bacterium]